MNDIASKCFKGIDKDRFLSKVTKAYMAIIGNGKEGIFCENSLDLPKNWKADTKIEIKLNMFDVLFTNPPFGAKIPIKGDKILSQYEFGYKWSSVGDEIKRTDKLRDNQPPQILFIERCLQLLKDGGKMAIVLPEGLLGNPTQEYIRKFILENSRVLAVVDAPVETFLPNTSTKTCILFLEKGESEIKNYKIFMAIAKKCGHDSRDNIVYKINSKGDYIYDEDGNKMIDDDFPLISRRYRDIKDNPLSEYDSIGFLISVSELRFRSLIPRFYNPSIKKNLKELEESYDFVTIGELIDNQVISMMNGQGVQKKYYGTGDIPYIRTSDISNWEVKIDPSKGVSDEIYGKFKQDLKVNDILFVKDGGRLIGTTCILSEKYNVKCLVQGHFHVLRCENADKLHPYLLFYLLNKPIVKKQVEANIVIQSTIPTIGERTKDIILPIPKNDEVKIEIIINVKKILEKRAALRKEIERMSFTPLE